MSRLASFALVLAGACSSTKPPAGDPWDAAVTAYIDAACTSPCVSGTEAQCRADLGAAFDRVKPGLDLAGHEQCAACLDLKTQLLGELAGCMPTADQTRMVNMTCDLDPNSDYDLDGIPDDDYSQACAGVP